MDESDRLSKKAEKILATTSVLGFILYIVSFALIGLRTPFSQDDNFSSTATGLISLLLLFGGCLASIPLFLKSKSIKPTDSNSNGLKIAIIMLIILSLLTIFGILFALGAG